MVRLPPLNPLRAFEATARLGSVSLAAQELNVTHSAVSHQIRSLETSLGVRLFERGAQRLKPTAQAATLLPAITSAFTEIAAATTKLTRPTTSGNLTVACTPALMSFWLMPRLSQFFGQYPEVRLTLISSNDPANIANPAIDICVLYGAGNWMDCWLRLWSNISFFPVASPTLINNLPLRTPRDLADHMILHGDADGHEWKTWLTAADARSFAPKNAQHFLNDARLSTEAALQGLGIALGDTITSRNMIARGELVAPFNLSMPASDAFFVACREEIRDTMIARIFIDWLFYTLEQNGPYDPHLSARHLLRRKADSSAKS